MSRRERPLPQQVQTPTSSSQATKSQQSSSIQHISAPSQNASVDFATYGTFHKAILSVFISKSIMDSQQIRAMFQQTCAACKVKFPDDLNAYMSAVATTVGTINATIKKYHLAIKKVCAETSVDSYYCLVNKSSHNLHQRQEVFSKRELEYLMELTNQILEADRGFVTTHSAGDINIPSKITQSGVEECLTKFAFQKFVVLDDQKGRVMLGPRALAELEPQLRQKYPESLKRCSFCQSIITVQGIKCGKCQGRCHPNCLIRQVDPEGDINSQLTCSYCQEPFPPEILDKYRTMATNKCNELAREREEEMDRQARVDQLNLGDGKKSGQGGQTNADSTMDYE